MILLETRQTHRNINNYICVYAITVNVEYSTNKTCAGTTPAFRGLYETYFLCF